MVVHSHFGHGPATYHLATSIHGHFVCEECGKLIEVPDSLFDGVAKQALSRFGFTIDPHRSAMLGRCADCPSHHGQPRSRRAGPPAPRWPTEPS